MLIYAGIDEAGYGPLLGPLCVGCAVFLLEQHEPAEGPPDLWRLLRGAVCRKASDRKRRIAVDDSKKLKGANDGATHPLRHLERGVLSFCASTVGLPQTEDDLLASLETEVNPRPWLETTSALPLAHTVDQLRIARGRVQRAMTRTAVRCEAMWCEAIDPESLNRGVAATGSKADVNFLTAVRLIERLWARWPDRHPRIILDRHGGRTGYAEVLATALPDTAISVIAETPTLSRYTLSRGDSKVTVSFALEGDGRYFTVALASMTAKYVRELIMLRLNRFFREQLPDLKPTAGYYGDGRRYITEIKPVLKRLRLSPAQLIRNV